MTGDWWLGARDWGLALSLTKGWGKAAVAVAVAVAERKSGGAKSELTAKDAKEKEKTNRKDAKSAKIIKKKRSEERDVFSREIATRSPF